MKIWKYYTPLQLLASCIWNTSESLKMPLGRFSPIIFGWMIGAKKERKN
jgi:K+-transporting ATPase A subunit